MRQHPENDFVTSSLGQWQMKVLTGDNSLQNAISSLDLIFRGTLYTGNQAGSQQKILSMKEGG